MKEKQIQHYGWLIAILKVLNNGNDHILKCFKYEDEVFIKKSQFVNDI